jgi:hypothetical protein
MAVLFVSCGCSFAADSDGDGLDDSVETNTGVYVDENNTGTDPNNPDTDGDFLKDGLEVNRGLSPVSHFNFSGDETSYTYIPATDSDGTIIYVDSPLANSASISSGDVWDITSGAVVTQASVAYDPPAERVLGFGLDGAILHTDSDFTFTIPEAKLVKGLYIHTDGDRSTRSFRLQFKDDSGAWIEHANVSFLDSGRIPFYANASSSAIIFAVDFPDFIASEFRMQFGSSNSRLGGSQPRIWEVDAITETLPSFQVIEGNFTWHEAKADAEAKGGRLAVLDTQEKIDATNAYLQELGEWPHLWIGLTLEAEEGLWKWVTGEPLGANNWLPGEPNNLGNEDGAAIYQNQTGWWYKALDTKASFGYILEVLEGTPAAPFIALDPLYESPSGEALTIDATPTIGFPTEFTYQWCFNGFKIPAALGGTAETINIDNLTANEGTWSVTVTNSEGIFEQDFEYRLYADSDSDGLSDGYEEFVSKTDINKPDTDDDGLVDGDEVNVYSTNPNSPDTDSDGFTDLYELETAYDPNSAESVPDALVKIMTAIEVKFNAALGATYAIEFSTDNQNWSVIEDDIVAEGGAVERLYSKTDFPTGFFRVERRDQ